MTHNAQPQVKIIIAYGRIGITIGLELIVKTLGVLHHIVVGYVVHPNIIAEVVGQGSGAAVMGGFDPKIRQLLPPLTIAVIVGMACHQIFDVFLVPHTGYQFIICKERFFHRAASFICHN